MEDHLNNNKPDLSSMSLKDLFFKYLRFLPLFILSAAVSLLIAFIYLRYATDIYSVSGTMMIKNDVTPGRNDKFEDMFMGGGNQNLQSEIENLRSKSLMARVVNSLNLQVSYFAVGKIKTANIYKQAPFTLEIYQLTDSASAFTLNIKFVNTDQFHVNDEKSSFRYGDIFENPHGVFRLTKKPNYIRPGNEYNIVWENSASLALKFSNAVKIIPKSAGTNILLISIETLNPQLGADIVNQLMLEYQKASIEDKSTTAIQSLDFIDERLTLLRFQLDSIKKNLLNYSSANDVVDIEAQKTMYFSNISETDKQINENRVFLSVADILEEYLKSQANAFNKVPSSLGINDPTLNALILEYNKEQLERERLIDGNVPQGNLLVKNKEEQIEKLRMNLLESIKNLKVIFSQMIDNLQKKSNTAQKQIRSIPGKTNAQSEIVRELEGKENLYKFLSEKREEIAISQASTISNSKVIDEALPSSTPVKPNRRTIQVLAILIGLGVPALAIFILELLNDKIGTRYDIERITDAPILGEIGHSYANNILVVNKTNRGMVAEQFRIIRSNLQYILNKIEKPVLLVTSSFSGEGKSFVTTNLGAVMGLAGKKTVVLEFDIRKPKILSGLNVPRKTGITNFLLGKSEIADLPVQLPGHENLYVIGSGPVPPNPAEMLLEQKVSDLFQYLRNNFDVILIDTAPVGMVSDAMILSKFADATLYIARQGHTYKKQVALIDEFYKEARLPRISIIINDVKMKPGYGYYGFGRYGYGYGYGSGYYEEQAPPRSVLEKVFGMLKVRKWNKKIKSKRPVS